MIEQVLPEFQKFLLSRGFVPEKNTPFYAHWVSRFLAFSNNHEDLPPDLRLRQFLQHLPTNKNIADWQITQAEEATRLYLDHYLSEKSSVLYPNNPQKQELRFADLSRILTQMSESIRIKHYSYRTERLYLDWVKRFYDYVTRIKKKDIPACGLDPSDVRDFLSYLATKLNVSSSTQNQAFNAILFLFRDVLKINLNDLNKTVRAKRGPKLPVVLAVEEIQKLFRHVKGKRNLLILQLLYGSGLRLMEVARLRIKDIDFNTNLIFVRNGKGDKDRSTILPECVKDKLHLHLQEVKSLHDKDLKDGYGEVYLPDALERKYPNAPKDWCWQYAFPSSRLSVDPRSGKIRRHHLGEKSIQNTMKMAAENANFAKHVIVHTLRHSFATHLLMNGVNIREVQDLLGHKNVETTMIYTHVIRDMTNAPRSPLDNLYENSCLHNKL